MMTPVTETYIQSGQVQRTIFLWASNRCQSAAQGNKDEGTITTASTVCNKAGLVRCGQGVLEFLHLAGHART